MMVFGIHNFLFCFDYIVGFLELLWKIFLSLCLVLMFLLFFYLFFVCIKIEPSIRLLVMCCINRQYSETDSHLSRYTVISFQLFN